MTRSGYCSTAGPIRHRLLDAGVTTTRVNRAMRRLRACTVTSDSAEAITRFAIRHPSLQPSVVAFVVDEYRRQGRPIPGEPR